MIRRGSVSGTAPRVESSWRLGWFRDRSAGCPGQQITVAAARRLAGQLGSARPGCGEVALIHPGLSHVFYCEGWPRLPIGLGMLVARLTALKAVAEAAGRSNMPVLSAALYTVTRLRAIRGIGEWTTAISR